MMHVGDKLEPEARKMAADLLKASRDGSKLSADEQNSPAYYSIAISLKRLADMMAGGGSAH